MSSTSPAVGSGARCAPAPRLPAGAGAGLGVDPRHRNAAIVGLSPARCADRARLRRASTRSACVRTRVLGIRGRRGVSAPRAARAHRPADPQAVGRGRRRDSPPRNPLRRRECLLAQGATADRRCPRHPGHRCGRAVARAPDGERPIDPRAPVRGSGQGAVPVVGRRSSTAPSAGPIPLRSYGESCRPNARRGGRRRRA